MKKLLIIGCMGIASCQEATTIPHFPKEAEEARKQSDSILKEFNRVNESLKSLNETVLSGNDSALQRLDSLAKGAGAIR